MRQKWIVTSIVIIAIALFIGASFYFDFAAGRDISRYFLQNSKQLLTVLPVVFVLIGLFEVWVKRETVERHLGKGSGARGIVWAILLGGTTLGSMIVALPIADTLRQKGARLEVIFTYIGAAAVCRIPMTVFEATYLGVPFTIIRYAVSIPLFVISAIIMGSILEKRSYRMGPAQRAEK